jgi:small nuclear ribonucleoprotein (snRNP)-like protein
MAVPLVAPGIFGPAFALVASTPCFLAPPSFVGITVHVFLYDVHLVWGTFVSFNPTWNLLLRDCVELHPQAGRHVLGPLVFPRTVIASLAIEPLLSPSLLVPVLGHLL